MSGATDPTRRPLSVTLVVAVLVLTAVFDAVVAFGLIEGRVLGLGRLADAAVAADPDASSVLTVLGWVIAAVAVAEVVLAALLARGHNGARLLVTLVIAARQAYSWALLAQFDGQAAQAAISLALSAVVLYLLWNRSASAFFTHGDPTAMGGPLASPFTEATRGSGTLIFDYLARLTVIALTIILTPGVQVTSSISLVLAVVGIAVAGWLLRPVFVRVAGLFGWAGAVVLALFANAAVIGLGFYLTPGIEVDGFLSVLLASWIYGFAMAALTWLFSINSQDYLTVHAVRMSRGRRGLRRRDDAGRGAGTAVSTALRASCSCSSTVCRHPCWRTRSARATCPRSAAGCGPAATRGPSGGPACRRRHR